MPVNFKELTREQRVRALTALGEKAFREKQIFKWICRGAESFFEMTDLSASLRTRLSKQFDYTSCSVKLVQKSSDGTQKFLLGFPDDNLAEAVFMKYSYGNSLCISTQIGCNMGCVFCASGINGKVRNLAAWEMLDEYIVCRKACGEEINHIVLMGMGEPFDNYEEVSSFLKLIHDPEGIGLSFRNITVSTCGIVPKIRQFGEDFPQVNLAISLHAASQEKREQIMPVAKGYPLRELIPACREHAQKTGRRVTFEYALIDRKNDSDEDIRELTALLKDINCHINLIPLNHVEESLLKSSGRKNAKDFSQKLEKLGIPCTVRRQLGADIDAACGQLRKKHTC